MNKDIELLNYIYQNAEMGRDSSKELTGKTIDDNFKKFLESQYNAYDSFCEDSKVLLDKYNKDRKDIGIFQKAMTYMSIDFKTMVDNSTSHIAEMMMKGSLMGIIDMIRKLKEYSDVDDDIKSMANKLLEFEEKTFKKLKMYL